MQERDLVSGKVTAIDLPRSNVLQFFLENGSRISVRPSGTEPKIKFYFSVKENLSGINEYDEKDRALTRQIDDILVSMKLT